MKAAAPLKPTRSCAQRGLNVLARTCCGNTLRLLSLETPFVTNAVSRRVRWKIGNELPGPPPCQRNRVRLSELADPNRLADPDAGSPNSNTSVFCLRSRVIAQGRQTSLRSQYSKKRGQPVLPLHALVARWRRLIWMQDWLEIQQILRELQNGFRWW